MTFDDLMTASNMVKNMSLAHEIAVDSEFKLEKMEQPQNRWVVNETENLVISLIIDHVVCKKV